MAAKKLTVLRTPLFYFLLISLSVWPGFLKAQDPAIEPVPNQPCPEAYDLLKDSKGYIWVAHDLGISRYDGDNFITLHNPQQNSLSLSGLVEDKKGRIWCHNFSGQIFYIENLQLHLLKEYRFEEEAGYAKMVICGDELVVASTKGLFIYNLNTGQAKYFRTPKGVSSLTGLGNKVVCYADFEWYCYQAGRPLMKLSSNLELPTNQGVTLHTTPFRDTIYMVTSRKGTYYKLTLEADSLKLHSVNQTSSFINTISVNESEVWINTKQYSFTTDGKKLIRDMNLSDVITDREGHRWMSSLKKGLCVEYNAQQLKKLETPLLAKGDEIRSLHSDGANLYMGSSNGKLYKLTGASAFTEVLAISKEAGAIERIIAYGTDHLLLLTSVGIYRYQTSTAMASQLPLEITIKEAALRQDSIFLAVPTGICRFPVSQLPTMRLPGLKTWNYAKRSRCRSFAFLNDSMVASFNDGIYIGYGDSLKRLLYNGRPIYAAKVKTVGSRVLIGSFNQGLLILENGTVRALTEADGLAANTIRDIKQIDGAAWLVYNDRFQKLNSTLTGVEDVAFPFSKIKRINDLAIVGQRLFIATGDGVYSGAITKPLLPTATATYIDRIVANGKDLITANRLKPFQNYLQFQVSTPFFSPYANIIYQYRIKNSPDSSWQRGSPGQSIFNLVALEPGIYDFEIVATDDSHHLISQPAVYHFEIEPPWYKQWFFRVGISLLLAALAFSAIHQYYQSRLRKQRLEYQKMLAVQAERQRISSEIHDDIGAGLSAIRLQTELTKNKLPESEQKQELGKLHAAISELSTKMREVIWSLNTDNDNLENLLYYLRRQALLLFENSPIQLKVTFPAQAIPDVVVKGEKRRHIYLAVKEALHNCLKHSEAQQCHLLMHVDEEMLHITVADDGKGFSPMADVQTGNGLPGMKRRMQQTAGLLEVESQQRTIVKFMIPLREKHA